MATISAEHILVAGTLRRHSIVCHFMCRTRCLRLFRPVSFLSWDLSVVLGGLTGPSFEHMESAPERFLTLKMVMFMALKDNSGEK